MLTPNLERLAARDEHVDGRAADDELDDIDGCLDHLFEVVDDHEQVAVVKRLDERVDGSRPVGHGDVQRPRQRRERAVRLAFGADVDEEDAIGEVVDAL